MRGKLRDKRDTQRDHVKRELMGRRPNRRDNRNLSLIQTADDDDDTLEEKDELTDAEELKS